MAKHPSIISFDALGSKIFSEISTFTYCGAYMYTLANIYDEPKNNDEISEICTKFINSVELISVLPIEINDEVMLPISDNVTIPITQPAIPLKIRYKDRNGIVKYDYIYAFTRMINYIYEKCKELKIDEIKFIKGKEIEDNEKILLNKLADYIYKIKDDIIKKENLPLSENIYKLNYIKSPDHLKFQYMIISKIINKTIEPVLINLYYSTKEKIFHFVYFILNYETGKIESGRIDSIKENFIENDLYNNFKIKKQFKFINDNNEEVTNTLLFNNYEFIKKIFVINVEKSRKDNFNLILLNSTDKSINFPIVAFKLTEYNNEVITQFKKYLG